MLKRKDYALYHEGDTSSSDEDDDEDTDNENESESESESEEEEVEEEEEEEEEDVSVVQRLKGVGSGGGWIGPMRCTLCGVLCLSEATMRTHFASKRHRKKMQRRGVPSDANGVENGSGYMELASGSYGPSRAHKRKLQLDKMDDGFEELETHTERLERLRKASASRRDAAARVDAAGGAGRGTTGGDAAKASTARIAETKKQKATFRRDVHANNNDTVEGDNAQEKKTTTTTKKKKLSGRQRQRQRKQRREQRQQKQGGCADGAAVS